MVVAHNAAIVRPDMFRAMILLSVPYGARAQADRSNTQAPTAGQQFYQTDFESRGVAEKDFDADPQRALRMLLCGSPRQATSGVAKPEDLY